MNMNKDKAMIITSRFTRVIGLDLASPVYKIKNPDFKVIRYSCYAASPCFMCVFMCFVGLRTKFKHSAGHDVGTLASLCDGAGGHKDVSSKWSLVTLK